MSHPARFRPDDPYLIRLREICLGLPRSAEKNSHGRPAFFTKKVFAMFGAVPPGDHDSDRWSQSLVVLPDPDERAALLDDDRFFHPAYLGPSGWVGLDFRAASVDWDEVTELVDASFRNTATVTLVRELDARHR